MNKRFLLNATFLLIGAIIVKILGGIFKIPLTVILGVEGLGVYQLIYPIFAMFLVAGNSFTLGISKLIASQEKESGVNKNIIFKASLIVLTLIGIVFMLTMLFLSPYLAKVQNNLSYITLYLILSPAILLSCWISGFKGYFQGIQKMQIVAFSQVIEQLFKIIFSLSFAYMLSVSLINGVSGVFYGIIISQILTLIYFILKYKKTYVILNSTISLKVAMKNCIRVCLPISLCATILPLSNALDSILIIPLLEKLNFSQQFSTSLFGYSSGLIGAIFNVPLVLSSSVATALMPSVSSQIKPDNKSVGNVINICYVISIIVSFVLIVFSDEISNIVLALMNLTIDLNFFSMMLKIGSLSIVYMTMVNIFNVLLQSYNKSYYATICVFVGVVIKTLTLVILVQNEFINIYGLFIAQILGFSLIAILELKKLKSICAFDLNFTYLIKKPTQVLLVIFALKVIYSFIESNSVLLDFIKLSVVGVSILIMLFYTNLVDKSFLKDIKIFKNKKALKV